MNKDQLLTKLRAIRGEKRTTIPTFNPTLWPAYVVKALEAASKNVGGRGTTDNVRRSINVVMGLIKRDVIGAPATPAAPAPTPYDF